MQRKVHVARDAEVHEPVEDVCGGLGEENLLEFQRGGGGAVSIGGVPVAESEIHEVLRAQILDGRALVDRVLRALRAVVRCLKPVKLTSNIIMCLYKSQRCERLMWERGLEVPVVDLGLEVPVVALAVDIGGVPELGGSWSRRGWCESLTRGGRLLC